MKTHQLQSPLSSSMIAGENLLAFDILELKACCNKNTSTELDELLYALSADQLMDTQTRLCLAG